ncbi:MAG: ATP-binding cassette domain-containing protein [Clostridia bacterium]|nr:ATP-binding cassette domain-containing protein [Clostridia bacterium]
MLSMRRLTRSFGHRIALASFSMDVEEGQTAVIMGPSGCGKSTVLRSIIALSRPDSGEILWQGNSVLDMSESELRQFRRKTGFVFQRSNLIGRLNVLQNVMLPAVMAGTGIDVAQSWAIAALEGVGMEDRSSAKVTELSGGEMQRVAIARAISGRPRLVLWDEPTASLDPILVVDTLKLIEGLIDRLEVTMVVVTHEVSFARRVADRVILMEHGAVVEEGPPDKVLVSPESRLGARYAGCLSYLEGQ